MINGIGGRFDQTLAHINTLYSGSDEYVYLLSEDSLSFVLEPVRPTFYLPLYNAVMIIIRHRVGIVFLLTLNWRKATVD